MYPARIEARAVRLFAQIIQRRVRDAAREAVAAAGPRIAHDNLQDDLASVRARNRRALTAEEIAAIAALGGAVDRSVLAEARRQIRSQRSRMTLAEYLRALFALNRADLTRARLEEFVRANIQVLEIAASEAVEGVVRTIAEGVARGDRTGTIAGELKRVARVSTSYARFVARDQTGSLLSSIESDRYQAAGSSGYLWDATLDNRTRPDHAALHGKFFTHSETAPGLTKPGARGPGDDYNCRCVRIPQFGKPEIPSEEDRQKDLDVINAERSEYDLEALSLK